MKSSITSVDSNILTDKHKNHSTLCNKEKNNHFKSLKGSKINTAPKKEQLAIHQIQDVFFVEGNYSILSRVSIFNSS